ncbi:helix-turn-helix transcriptional regulator [Azospirillum argentinense]
MVKSQIRSSTRVMEEALKRQIGVAVRGARKRAGLTQEELAGRVGKSTEAVSNIERGRALPTLTTLMELARALDEPLPRLVADVPVGTPKAMKRLTLELQLRSLADQLDDRVLEVAVRQVSALADLRR